MYINRSTRAEDEEFQVPSPESLELLRALQPEPKSADRSSNGYTEQELSKFCPTFDPMFFFSLAAFLTVSRESNQQQLREESSSSAGAFIASLLPNRCCQIVGYDRFRCCFSCSYSEGGCGGGAYPCQKRVKSLELYQPFQRPEAWRSRRA